MHHIIYSTNGAVYTKGRNKKYMYKKPLHPDIYLGSALILFIILVLTTLFSYPGIFSAKKTPLVCTEEAKVCADGTVVTRGGDFCAFTPCPPGKGMLKNGITEEPLEAPNTVPEKKPEALQPTPPIKKEVMCTMEAKLCSNGSFVGRVAPDCDFAPCPDLLEYESDH